MSLRALLLLLLIVTPVGADEWRQYASPADAGWSVEGLERARSVAEEAGAAAVMVIEDGNVFVAWGQVDRALPLYSMRKGMYNALVGLLVAEGKIDIENTLAELGIDDEGGLTEVERTATVEDLLVSRSGIYHESAYEPGSMKRNRPERGTHAPGEHWFYNNWDFNLVAHLVEQAGGAPVGEQFRDRVAKPLGMQDFSVDDTFTFLEPSRSHYPAILFRMSARDVARVGQLYLQDGRWKGKQLLPAEWVETSWTPHVRFEPAGPGTEGNGFGYLWWIYPASDEATTALGHHDMFVTRGSDGQVLAVIPSLDLVAVHLTDTENGVGGDFRDAIRVLAAVVAAKEGAFAEGPELVDLVATPLPNAKPAPLRRTAVAWAETLFDSLVGTYALGPQITIDVYEYDGRLFARPDGVPLAEVELFVDGEGMIFSPAVDLELEIVEAEGEVTSLQGRMDGRQVRIEKK